MGLPAATLLLSATVSLLGGLIFGYELGIISGALLQLKNAFLLTCFKQEALVSSILIGALFASIIGGFLIDRFGRWTSIISSNVLVLLGSSILIFSRSFWSLIIGRVAIGFAISISSMACCIYISEIVQPHQRGRLVSLYETGITIGILTSYGMNYFFSSSNSGWKYMFLVAVFPAILQLISILFLPSTPTKINTSGQESQSGTIQLEDFAAIEDVKPASSMRVYSFLDLFRSRDNMRTRTLVGLGLVLFQQLTGQPNVLYYASTIFRAVGFQSNSSAVLASVGLGIVKVLSTLVAMSYADKAGRRILLLAGCIIMAISVTGIGFASFMVKLDTYKSCESIAQLNASSSVSNSSVALESISDIAISIEAQRSSPMTRTQVFTTGFISRNTSSPQGTSLSSIEPDHSVLNWITLLSLMAFVSAFSIGFGPMTWLVLSEIYPTEIRGRAFAFCNCLNWGTNLLITLSFLDVIESIGLSWTFFMYGLMGVVATVFIYYFIPETKGRTLEEIDEQFSDKSFRFINGNPLCGRFGIKPLSEPEYQRMGQPNTSDSSLSSGS
ncbi:solute carrier family 2, facilitated glucose transporter member 10 [Pseudophryne corroboree]|uniref:solute carrier family 2, facilitated glucose transporter member 10 n=1 Tax=Pseudophryne corroboree TaxID=495146 RepID=UPI0030819C0F